MKRKTKVVLGLTAASVVVLGGATVVVRGNGGDQDGPRSVVVERGTVVAKALAVGTIEPETEISVKSKVSGVVRRLVRGEGDYVEAGAPLLEIRPDPTPLELVEARRAAGAAGHRGGELPAGSWTDPARCGSGTSRPSRSWTRRSAGTGRRSCSW
jgi:multidrug efflux pump subunit AcrA (membrane-fusion protein)